MKLNHVKLKIVISNCRANAPKKARYGCQNPRNAKYIMHHQPSKTLVTTKFIKNYRQQSFFPQKSYHCVNINLSILFFYEYIPKLRLMLQKMSIYYKNCPPQMLIFFGNARPVGNQRRMPCCLVGSGLSGIQKTTSLLKPHSPSLTGSFSSSVGGNSDSRLLVLL